MTTQHRLLHIDDFVPLVGKDAVERVYEKARPLQSLRVAHVNSTYYGGGVAELLSSLVLLMNSVGIRAEWRVIQGRPDFFSVTKKMHNALQGGDVELTDAEKKLYEEAVFENSVRNHLDHDFVVVHDPQPLPLIEHYRRRGAWVWRCHIDLTQPHPAVWQYLSGFVERYDAVILSLKEYARQLATPQRFFLPAINPFTATNREMTEAEIDEQLTRYGIPNDLPLVVQVSRFDRWKDPEGVIEAFNLARKEVPSTLVLLGNMATDDPEGDKVYESLLGHRDDRVIILSVQESSLVNALQRRAAVVLQKSLREGFGLTVAEAMWKGTPVIGGNVGGIRYQIEDGVNGYLVSSVPQAAEAIVRLTRDKSERTRLGLKAKESVHRRFLMLRLLEQYLDLFASFETVYRLKSAPFAG